MPKNADAQKAQDPTLAFVKLAEGVLGDQLLELGRYLANETDLEPKWLPAMPVDVHRAVGFQRAQSFKKISSEPPSTTEDGGGGRGSIQA